MKKLGPLVVACLALSSAWAQDDCATAVPITAGTYTVALVDGSEVPLPICAENGPGASAGEWYTYTPSQDYGLTVTTDLPVNAGGDTRLHIYSGSCGALVCEAGDDDGGSGYLSVASVNVTAGVTYTIAFDNYWSSGGFDFQVIEGPPIVTLISFNPQTIPSAGYVTCVVDMDGDHLDDAVDVTTNTININHQQAGGGFVNTNITTTPADNDASWSIAAGDLDDNGYNDLMYGGGGGVTFMMANANGTAFTEVSFPQYVFCQRTNMVDINDDGALDAFSCHDVAPNVYYLNDGNGNLTFHQGGLGDTPYGGNYGSIWIDYDNDHDIDMFIAKCGSSPPDQLHRNNGDGTFTDVATSLGLDDDQESWSSAWGDYDNDGDMDVMVGTSSGDYQKLLRNDGGTFTNVTPGSGFDTFGGTDIEWVAHDFNNDGWVDVFGGGAIMLNDGDMTFTMSPIPIGVGPIGDLNDDGFLDIVNGNTVHLNEANANHFINVNTIGTVSNRNGIGARVVVTSPLGTQIRDVKSGDGFGYMSSMTAHFGLGPDTQVQSVTVYWPSGIVDLVNNPTVDAALNLVEGSFAIGIEEISAEELDLFPNPAQDILHIRTKQDLSKHPAIVLDAGGKQVLVASIRQERLDISSLPSGSYLLQVEADGRLLQRKFSKR